MFPGPHRVVEGGEDFTNALDPLRRQSSGIVALIKRPQSLVANLHLDWVVYN